MAFSAAAVAAAALLGGCAPTVTVNGETYEALTPKEENELVMIARASLKRAKKAVSPQDYQQIQSLAPEVSISYYGDRTGDAKVTWKLDGHSCTVEFKGQLLSDSMAVHMYTVQAADGILDYSQKKPVLRRDSSPAGTGSSAGSGSLEDLLKSPAR